MNSSRIHRCAARGCLALFGGLLLAGCAGSGGKVPTDQRATLNRIGQEIGQAGNSLKQEPTNRADKVGDAMLPSLQVDVPKATAEAVEPRFDLVVSKAPAAQVFMAIVANTPYSMLVPSDMAGDISVSLKNVTVREALDALRDLYGYQYKVSGSRIHVQSNSMQSRLFQVSYLAGKRSGSSDLRVSGSSLYTTGQSGGAAGAAGGAANPGGATGGTTVKANASQVSMTSETDFWGELKTALTALIGTDAGRSVIVNPMSGVVLVRGMPQDMAAVENYLRATQLIIERQVMLEAKIVDVSLSDEFQSGINWAAFGSRNKLNAAGGVVSPGARLGTAGEVISDGAISLLPGTTGALATASSGAGFAGLALQTDNFSSLISFLETQGNVQVLSSPRIATLNNQKAVLKVGSDEYFVTNVSTTTTSNTTGGATTTPTITLAPFFSGISLDVTPQIDENSSIILHVHPSVSVVAEKTKVIDLGSLGNFVLPVAASAINETDSIVRVRDGNIVAIGGLMKQEQSGDRSQLPGLGDTPLLGGLFGQRASSLKKRELVILIKPTIIQGAPQWGRELDELRLRLEGFGMAAGDSSDSGKR